MSFLQETGIRVLNHVRHRMELGRDTYATGKISTELTDELCAVLLDFKQMMKEFGVEDYRACATSAIRETRNTLCSLVAFSCGLVSGLRF